jgi:hypothetical protein
MYTSYDEKARKRAIRRIIRDQNLVDFYEGKNRKTPQELHEEVENVLRSIGGVPVGDKIRYQEAQANNSIAWFFFLVGLGAVGILIGTFFLGGSLLIGIGLAILLSLVIIKSFISF